MKFFFGNHYEGISIDHRNHSNGVREIDAPNLARAIRQFRVGELYPHTFSDKRIPTKIKRTDGYDGVVYLASQPGATIPVYATCWFNTYAHTPEPEVLARISPEPTAQEEAEFAEARALLPDDTRAVLGALTGTTSAPSTSTALVVAGEDWSRQPRQAMATRHLELIAAQAKLEAAKQDLERQKAALAAEVTRLQAEIATRMQQVWIIELFLGSKEEVHVLRRGAPASADTPVSIMQRVLCMDEEMLVHDFVFAPDLLIGTLEAGEDGSARDSGRDCRDLAAFDAWLLADPSRVDHLLPRQKGIVALRPRREAKSRSWLHVLEAVSEAEADTHTYLLVRNGENLYRLWIDVAIWPRFFPKTGETRDQLKDAEVRHIAAGFAVVQGLLDRSDLFHPLASRINVFQSNDAGAFELVRDDDGEKLLGSGDGLDRITWWGYSKWLQAQLGPGQRVVWAPDSIGGRHDPIEHRILNNQAYRAATGFQWPEHPAVYTLTEDSTQKFPMFLYDPKRARYVSGQWVRGQWVEGGSKDLSRRYRFRAYTEELVPLDRVSWRVLRHLLLNRAERENYHEAIGALTAWWQFAKAEARAERPFVDLVLRQVGADQDDAGARARVERLLRWWKTKTKTHRALGVDEAKALRMIVKAFRAGEDHDDPEVELLAAGL